MVAAGAGHGVRHGLNYADHASELEFKAPEEPLVFLKAPNTLTGHRRCRCARPAWSICITKPSWWR